MLNSGILSIDFDKNSINADLFPVVLKENGCLPTPKGNSIHIDNKFTLYDLGKKMDWQQVRKTLYLFRYLLLGNTPLKINFFKNKIKDNLFRKEKL